MANEATVVVDPQPTVVEKVYVQPEKMSTEQRAHWLRTGENEFAPKKAESAPAKTDEKAVASDPKDAASEAGKKEPQQQPKPRATATDRKQELSADIQDLLEKRGVLKDDKFWDDFQEYRKSKTAKADSSPAPEIKPPAQTEFREPTPPEKPKRPDLTEFNTVEQYNVAMDKYDASMSEYQAEKAAYETAKASAEKTKAEIAKFNKDIEEKWKGMVAEAEKEYVDFKEVALSADLTKHIPIGSPLDQWALQSSAGAKILYYYGKNREELKALQALSYPEQHEELLALHIELGGTAKSAKKVEESQVADEVPPPAKAKTVTQAPPPPREVGGRATVSEDPIKDAVARRDFDSFREKANERDIARRKRGR